MISKAVEERLLAGKALPSDYFTPADPEWLRACWLSTRAFPKQASLAIWRRLKREEQIIAALETTHGDVVKAARLINLSHVTLYQFLKRFDPETQAALRGQSLDRPKPFAPGLISSHQ